MTCFLESRSPNTGHADDQDACVFFCFVQISRRSAVFLVFWRGNRVQGPATPPSVAPNALNADPNARRRTRHVGPTLRCDSRSKNSPRSTYNTTPGLFGDGQLGSGGGERCGSASPWRWRPQTPKGPRNARQLPQRHAVMGQPRRCLEMPPMRRLHRSNASTATGPTRRRACSTRR